MKFVQRFHTILLFAQKSGLSFIDPFGNFRFNFDKTDRGYLTQEEIDTSIIRSSNQSGWNTCVTLSSLAVIPVCPTVTSIRFQART